jgi:membrane protease YdiL (CAAX protease family)
MDERAGPAEAAPVGRWTRSARAGIVLCALGAVLGLETCQRATPAAADDAAALGVASLGLELFLACLAIGGALASRRPLRTRLGLGPGRLPTRSLALLVVGTLALSQALDGVLELTGLRERSALADLEVVLAGASGPGLALALLGVGLAPGVCEELLCRGLLQRGLETRLGAAPAVVIAALVFGALHLEPVHAVFATFLGLWLGATALLAGSVRAPILCHAVNNLVAVGLAARLPDLIRPGVGSVAGGLAVAGACLLAARRSAPASAGPPAAPRALQPTRQSDEQ